MTSSTWTSSAESSCFAIGIDIEKIERFSKFLSESEENPMPFVFTPEEFEHARSAPNRAAALCASFCCKEAMRKALGKPYNFNECLFTWNFESASNPVFLDSALQRLYGIEDAFAHVSYNPQNAGELLVAVYLCGKSAENRLK